MIHLEKNKKVQRFSAFCSAWFRDSKKGMTFIEVLTIVAIILILTSAVIFNPRPSADLDRAARQLAADLRRAQNMAMSAEEQGGEVPCGYGIGVTNPWDPNYEFFYNPPNVANSSDCSTDAFQYLPGFPQHSILYKSESLDKINVAFCKNKSDFPGCGDSSIYFPSVSGTPIYMVQYLEPYWNSGVFVLSVIPGSCSQGCKYITITSAGKIEIQ